jgi:hypothetical protein
MTLNAQRIQRASAVTVICCFVVFTALCWFLDLISTDHLEIQTRPRDVFDAGLVSGLLALLCSVLVRRSHRRLAILGLVACFLWTVWILLPRF